MNCALISNFVYTCLSQCSRQAIYCHCGYIYIFIVCLFVCFSVGVGYVLSVSLVSQCKDVASTDSVYLECLVLKMEKKGW